MSYKQVLYQLTKPYPFVSKPFKRWLSALAISIFIVLFLWVFQPFGMSGLAFHPLFISLGYGAVCFICIFLLDCLAMFVFPRFYREEGWTTAKEICWSVFMIACIGLGNAYYSTQIGMGSWSIDLILQFEVYTLSVGVFPTVINSLLRQKKLSTKYETESTAINTILSSETIHLKSDESTISLRAENGKDVLEINPDEVLFIRSSDNYVEVFYGKGGNIEVKLLRTTLKKCEDAFSGIQYFMRCHKSFLVNLKKVMKVSGNAQGYKLYLQNTDEIIPVSRTLNGEIRDRLHTIHPKIY